MSNTKKDGAGDRKRRPYRPYGLQSGETRPLPPAIYQPDERRGWSHDDYAEARAEYRAGCGGG